MLPFSVYLCNGLIFYFLYLISVNILTNCKQNYLRCLHFSKLILLVCKTLGFTS